MPCQLVALGMSNKPEALFDQSFVLTTCCSVFLLYLLIKVLPKNEGVTPLRWHYCIPTSLFGICDIIHCRFA